MGRARIQNDAPAVLVRNLRVVGTGYQGKLVPAPYFGGQFVEKAVGAFGIVDVPHVLPDALPAQQSVIRRLVHHHHVLLPGNGFSVILQGNGHIGRAHGAPAAQAGADGFHRGGEKQGRLDRSRVHPHHQLRSGAPRQGHGGAVQRVGRVNGRRTAVLDRPVRYAGNAQHGCQKHDGGTKHKAFHS